MSDIVFIEGNPSLVRDISNNGVMNTNVNSYNKYINTRSEKEKEKCKIENIESDLKCLKDDLCEIKKLLLNFKHESI